MTSVALSLIAVFTTSPIINIVDDLSFSYLTIHMKLDPPILYLLQMRMKNEVSRKKQ